MKFAPRAKSYMSVYCARSVIHVHTQALRQLGNPKLVRFRINHSERMILLEVANDKDGTSFWVSPSIYTFSKNHSFRICSAKLTKEIQETMGWNEKGSYRIPGWMFPEGGFARFDLDMAVN